MEQSLRLRWLAGKRKYLVAAVAYQRAHCKTCRQALQHSCCEASLLLPLPLCSLLQKRCASPRHCCPAGFSDGKLLRVRNRVSTQSAVGFNRAQQACAVGSPHALASSCVWEQALAAAAAAGFAAAKAVCDSALIKQRLKLPAASCSCRGGSSVDVRRRLCASHLSV